MNYLTAVDQWGIRDELLVFHFSKPLKFANLQFWVMYQNGQFLRARKNKYFTPEKKKKK